MGIKMQLLKPDMEETQSAMKRYQSQGVSNKDSNANLLLLESWSCQNGASQTQEYKAAARYFPTYRCSQHFLDAYAYGLHFDDQSSFV